MNTGQKGFVLKGNVVAGMSLKRGHSMNKTAYTH